MRVKHERELSEFSFSVFVTNETKPIITGIPSMFEVRARRCIIPLLPSTLDRLISKLHHEPMNATNARLSLEFRPFSPTKPSNFRC